MITPTERARRVLDAEPIRAFGDLPTFVRLETAIAREIQEAIDPLQYALEQIERCACCARCVALARRALGEEGNI